MKNLLIEDIALWEAQAEKLPWFKKWTKVLDGITPFYSWFKGGLINASHACLDVHIQAGRGEHTAILWENEKGDKRSVSYQELYELTNRIAFELRLLGVKKGDTVVVYLPMIPEAVATMLAIARLGAIHVVVFSGFGADALRDRITDVGAKIVVTTDFDIRRGKRIPLKEFVDKAVEQTSGVSVVLVDSILRGFAKGERLEEYYVLPEPVESSHPLFVLYTSGSTGKPKGIMHSTGGYLTYVYSTIKWAFNINESSVYWCTADIGWITGHSYVAYGPLMHGATMVMYDGAPDSPQPDIWWQLIERYKVTIFYTAPTALRFFMKLGDALVRKHDLSSLQVLGSVGEPLNPQVWHWYNDVVGGQRCPIIDTWWQTETGGFMIAPTAFCHPELVSGSIKPGSVAQPLPGIEAGVVDEFGEPVEAETRGFLVIKKPWPGMPLGFFGQDQERYLKTYWERFPGMYFSGDYAIKDADGYFWMLGRADEVLNIAGHRVGTAEIESAMLTHSAVAEAAAIGVTDDIKGETVVVFVILRDEYSSAQNISRGFSKGERLGDNLQAVPSCTSLEKELIVCVQERIGKFVTPSGVHILTKLPKTRSGKIMRRVLKAMVHNTPLGDVTTMEDDSVIEEVLAVYRDFLARR